MRGRKIPYHEALNALKNYTPAQVAADNLRDYGIQQLNHKSEVEVPIERLARAIQPVPTSHRRKVNLIVNHLFHQGYYAKRPAPTLSDN